ncbi:acetylornithine deacetylase [Marinobacter halodurans]|uniref:Acetylornithine deacetylase n=1 Tax=Marinobacter halodurans TaxID=2528979 RepID=A0ABY1ZQ49_9GAMM|nr:acetylornithine deacetylase [Marinobacter halodurans]TBW58842.1 acetylornithine deacetylase [Marinobacter halodurans]
MKKLLLSLVCLLLLAYVGFKGAAWYQVHSLLERAHDALEEQGVLTWGRIGSSLSGHVSVYDLEFQPFLLTQPVRATRVTFSADAVPELLDALSGGPLPGHWTLRAENLRLQLASPLLRDWVGPRNAAISAGLINIPCGHGSLGLASLMSLGIGQVAGDLKVEQDNMLDDAGGLNVDIQAGKLGSADIRLPGLRLDRTLDEGGSLQDYSGPVAVELRDGGFMRRLAAYCARAADIGPEEWAEQATRTFSEQLQATGYQPSDQLRALYKVWLRDGGELKATLTAGEPLLGLPERDRPAGKGPVDPNIGGFDVFYNGARVPDLFVRYLPPAPVQPVVANGATAPEDGDGTDSAAFRPADPEQAARWPDRRVRVTLKSGRVVDGRLSGVTDSQLEVTRLVDGGEVAYPLARSAITLFEVWRRTGDAGIEPAPETEGASPLHAVAPTTTDDAGNTPYDSDQSQQ